jgi:hypothetical protein
MRTIWLSLILLIAHAGSAKAWGSEWSMIGYTGQWSATPIGDILLNQTAFRSSYVTVAGGSRTLQRFRQQLNLELEVNAANHTGRQGHSEINTALLLRWTRFPWDRILDTSVAYGLGPSYAFRAPEVEQRSRQPASQLLVFMPVEVTFAPPRKRNSDWELLVRVHHRSGAFGVVSDSAGSNFVSAGFRYRFSGNPASRH